MSAVENSTIDHNDQDYNKTDRSIVDYERIEATSADAPVVQMKGETFPIRNHHWASIPVRFQGRQLLTALQTLENTMYLVSWRVDANGQIIRTGESTEKISCDSPVQIACGERFVTAHSYQGQLYLNSWHVSTTGAISLAGQNEDKPNVFGSIRLAQMGKLLLVMNWHPGKNEANLSIWQHQADGRLCLTYLVTYDSWETEATLTKTPLLLQLDQERFLTITTATNYGQFDAEHPISTQCRIQLWRITGPRTIVAVGIETILQDIRPQQALRGCDQEQIILYAESSGGSADKSARLVWLQVEDDGSIRVLSQYPLKSKTVSQGGVCAWPQGVLSAVLDENSLYQLIRWQVPEPQSMVPAGDTGAQLKNIKAITLCSEQLEGTAPFVTAVHTHDDELKLISWHC
ncbi:MAG: hypothetical protein AAF702_50590 [Chloroflexota bacterium]